ncbi:MAG: hypothetical protein JXA52_03015 [Planctomycetes bacterium]|nr:hypothetical protein [Planctomycetota bacterium]
MRITLLTSSSSQHDQAWRLRQASSRCCDSTGKSKQILLLLTIGLLLGFSYQGSVFAAQPNDKGTLELVEEMDVAAIEATSEEKPEASINASSGQARAEGEFEDFNVVLARIEAEHARLAAIEQDGKSLDAGSPETLMDIPDSLDNDLPAVSEMTVDSTTMPAISANQKRPASILRQNPAESAAIELIPTPQTKAESNLEIDLSASADRNGSGIFLASEAGLQDEIVSAPEAYGQGEDTGNPEAIASTGAEEQVQMDSELSDQAAEQIRRQRLLKKMRQVEAERKTENAEQLAEAGDHESALKLMEDAQRLDPESSEISERVRELRALVEKSGEQSIIQSTLNRAKIESSASAMRVERRLDQAEELLVAARSGSEEDELLEPDERLNRARGNIMNALKALDTADALLEGSMIPSRSEKRQKSAMLREELLAERVRIDEELRAISIARAQSEVAAAKKEYDDSITRKIDSMMKSAEYHIERREYSKAIEVTNQLLKMYPNYIPAKKLRDQARTLNFNTREDDIQRRLEISEEQGSLDVNEMAIAASSTIIYPEDWEELNIRRAIATKVEASEDWKREIQHKLENTPINLGFEETPLEDVLIYIREQGNLNLLWDRTVDLQQTITITVNNMTLGPALDWVLDLCSPSLHREMRDQALYISTEPRSDVEIRLYPVYDITKSVNDYTGGDLGIGGETGADTGDIFGDDDDDDDDTTGDDDDTTGDEDQAAIVNDILDVIPGNWDTDLRVSIDVWNDQLLVIQTPQVHKEIEKYLQDIRATMKQQVLVEGRFLQVVESFLEEIGFAWTGPANDTESAFPPGGVAGLFETGHLPSGWMHTSTTSSQGLGRRGILSGLSMGTAADYFADNGGITMAYKYISSEPLHAYEVNAILDAVRRNRKGSILHNPKLLIANGRTAFMQVSTTSNYVSGAEYEDGYVTPTIDDYPQGVTFQVRPVISFDKKYITTQLWPYMTEWDAENSYSRTQTFFTRTEGGEDDEGPRGTIPVSIPISFPAQRVIFIQTTVTIPTGGTIIIGGLMRDSRRETVRGVPFISDLPFFGRLTRHENLEREKSNLIMMIGARIIELEQ